MSRTGARRYWPIWVAVIPLVVWTAIRLFGLEGGYPLVALMAFTPYAAIAALFATGVAAALRNWAATATAALVLACLAAVVLPRTIGSSTAQAAGHETLTVLSANVHVGGADPAGLVGLVDRFHPDLLSVQELTPSFAAKLRRAGIYRRLFHSLVLARPGAGGAGLYTRLPLARLPHQTHFFFRMPRAAITLPGGGRIRVVGVHPYPPLSGHTGSWGAALESLPATGAGAPWVLAGDFNATLDDAKLREVVDRGYRDAGDVTGNGLEPTFPTMGHRLLPPVITIDHVLADRRIGIADYGVVDLPGSDHRAIHTELVLP
ncbi:MAG TPA: endonuclease/exonuclease/phosphatase family protein [Solirubrobacterales bacterium]|nr:endonuclease/exonuclease/phosphatase family protein [Solirubrobacterales bacterium]